MLSFTEWLRVKKKEKKDEQRSGHTNRESGHVDQQGKAAGFDTPKLTQTVHLLAVPE